MKEFIAPQKLLRETVVKEPKKDTYVVNNQQKKVSCYQQSNFVENKQTAKPSPKVIPN